MSYFRVHSHCRFVSGETWGALFDLFQSRVFWISDPLGRALLEAAEANASLEEVAVQTSQPVASVERYARTLENLDWGFLQDAPFYTERYAPMVLNLHERKLALHRVLRQATLEVTGRCSLNCPGCGFHDGLATALCACGRWPEEGDDVAFSPSAVIEQLAAYGCDQVCVAGGDPLLNAKVVEELLVACSQWGLRLLVQTPGVALTAEHWRLLAQHGATVILPIFGAEDASYDRATRTSGGFQRLLAGLEAARLEGVQLAARVILTLGTLAQRDHIVQWLTGQGIPVISQDAYIPWATELDEAQRSLALSLFRTKPARYATSLEGYLRATKGHWCWQDTIAITRAGDILPCIAARRHAIANVNQQSLVEVLREKAHGKFRNASRDTFESCRGCELRYGCTDCSVQTERLCGQWKHRAWDCVYAPETGQWSEPALKVQP